MNNEQLNKILMKADDDLQALKDRCHELYEENERLKTNLGELQNAIDNIAELVDVPEGMSIEDVYDKVKDYKTRCEKVVEILHNLNDTLPLDLILSEIEHSENILQNGNDSQ